MSFRTRCPACGRRQSLEDGDAGHTIWCPACGTKFIAKANAPESETDNSSSDINAPASLATLSGSPAALAIRDLLPPPPPIPPPDLLASVQASLPSTPTPAIRVQAEPIVQAQTHRWLVPALISTVALLGVLLLIGIAAIIYLLNQNREISAPPPPMAIAPAAVHSSEQYQTFPIASATPPQQISLLPSTNPTTAPIEKVPAVAFAPLPPPPLPDLPKFHPIRAPTTAPDLDDQIGQSIDRGVNFLLSQFTSGKLKPSDDLSGMISGADALAVYALLQAGEATHDLRLASDSAQVGKMLDTLKTMPIEDDISTYSHSLRSAALSVYHRPSDKQALRDAAEWLIKNARFGSYSYGTTPIVNLPPEFRNRFRFDGVWDNSNSQYGALGVWAALEAGVEVPNAYWQAVDKHWLGCQLPDGEWAYRGYGDMGRMSMTVAGITTLFVAEDQLDAHEVVATLGHAPFSPALAHGLKWLEAGDNSVHLPPTAPQAQRTYSLFGLERAALASGFKYFGTHDWYRELAGEQLGSQNRDGSWDGSDPDIDTSYTLLFLSRGRHPIFMNKLRFDGYWSNRPRDIANLTHYAANALERPINWQVVSLKSGWADWMDSPVLYIASHEALKLTEADCDKLRSYAQNGGLIFTHADGDSPAFSKSIAELSRKLFPQYPLADLPSTHPIFSTLYKIKLQPKLQGISNGSRLLLVHSPTDINKAWQQRDWVEHPVSYQMGLNLFIYAAGKANLRNKLKTPLVPDSDIPPIKTAQIAQLKYNGDFDPEPVGLPRFAKLFLQDTSVKLDVLPADPAQLDPAKMPLAHLTGTGAVPYDSIQLKAIHDYVESGGTLLIDACGGSPTFVKSMLLDFLPHAFPKSLMLDIPKDHPILAGTGDGMTSVTLRLRPFRTELDGTTQQPIEFFTLGKGMVIFTPIDLSTGLLGTNTWGVNGYEPSVVYDLVRNILLFKFESAGSLDNIEK